MSMASIQASIASKVSSVGSLHGSFNYEAGKATGYPYATVVCQEFSSEFGDSAGSSSGRNLVKYTFRIGIYQEREEAGFGAEKAERVLMEVVDEISTAFHQDTTLSGSVLWQRPVRGGLSYEERDLLVRSAEVFIETMSAVDSK